ncbi:Probable cysteinyl-tRNA synthetase [Taphrina deformans PYCC 5710]|uniref:cysteine--tRNA ligase n=1 Tax=Taphrina deformans (strain PYCC 5710 / ATCC 11124 / CBS 356.35 / IMI 108563 / JCM 9778 / NBRC 8474) TaxID=1097556 RepID=R4X9R4_TAPDE|nr:Probable cysteinyl-tRNA synthetase [Taphrina deformans PYCC 5710]|eukprot:CCG82511.1 Probable cysteinyl-tRNA synthetase [Taphrina deformans PYCC 5710]
MLRRSRVLFLQLPTTVITTPAKMKPLRELVTQPVPLSFYDSLEKRIRPFTLTEGQDQVRWYSCGPTVYDASHMGHARNYVTTDILRRLIKDYFGYQVRYVQNVTDVDDKIIIKARHNLLFEQYKRRHASDWREQKHNIEAWWVAYRQKFLGHVDTEAGAWAANVPKARDVSSFPKDQMSIDTLTASAAILSGDSTPQDIDHYLDPLKDIIIFGIDTPDQVISNEDIFKSSKDLTTYWEQKFDEDMANLNVLKPDKVVRVTEFMQAIIDFVQNIIKNGFAYEANGSVYFNVAQFISSGHDYAKLKPSTMSASTDALLAEAEGSLSTQISHAKKSQRDFALWKASKSGEPYWQSPWGEGRPGWHIECSAMASCEFGSSMDIHSGGEDLTFPHHDNELAQSEAAHGCHEWVRYFLHTGHLHIHGMKMSKSLKNFITIEEVLTTGGMTSRTMRLLFLSGKWRGRVDYNDDLIKGVRTTEQKFSEYFVQFKALLNSSSSDSTVQDDSLQKSLQQCRDDVDAALANDFETPQMLGLLRDLLSEANKTLSSERPPIQTLREVTEYFTRLFEIVGIDAAEDGVGWQLEAQNESLLQEIQRVAEYRQQIREVAIKPLESSSRTTLDDIMTRFNDLTVLSPELLDFRTSLGTLLSSPTYTNQEIMTDLDNFRDYTLVNMGIALDDKKDSFILKSGNREELISKREQKLQEGREKAAKREETRRREVEQLERGKVPAQEMFRADAQYLRFDERGVPTHVRDADGQETAVSKSLSKKLAKEYGAQEKLNKKYNEWLLATQ